MKKLFTLLTLLVALVTSAWAQGTYAVKSGDAAVASGTVNTSVTNMKFTWGVTGGNDFKGGNKNSTVLESVLGATAFCEGNGANGSLAGGTVYFFEPAQNGTLIVGFVLNANKNFYVQSVEGETGTDVAFTSFTNASGEEVKNSEGGTFASGDVVSAKLTGGLVTFEVLAGKKYAVYCSGSKLGYYGFKYTLAPTETYTVTFDAGSYGTCATTSLTEESVGAGVTLPAVTANSGYAFKAWYTAADGGSLAGKAGDTYNPSSNITLYAQYAPAINRIGFNTYYVAEGDEVVSGTQVVCDDITMEYGQAVYDEAVANGLISDINANYVASISSPSSNGWGVKFTPSSDGVLSVGVIINGTKTFSITNASWFNYNGNQDNGTNGEGIIQTIPAAGSIPSNTWTPAKKQYTIITIPVTAGTSYNFSVAGSKMAFYGFEFTKGASATASAVIGSTGWATFVAPTALDFTGISDLKAYIVTGHIDAAVTVEQMTGTVPAGTPLLLEGVTTTIPIVASSSTDVSANLLKAGGAEVSPEDGKTKYALSVAEDKAVFKKIVAETAIPAGKAYLEFAEEIAAPSLSFGSGETTGISTTNFTNDTNNGEYYNLAGQRVAQPTKGLYIVNGKKYMVK